MPVVLILLFIAVFGVFFAVVGPLFDTSGPASADLAGELPMQASAGHQVEIDVGYDNTGTSFITPVCIRVDVQGPLRPRYAVFLSIDRVPFVDGRACGGALAGGNTVSVRVVLDATAPGNGRYALTALQGRRELPGQRLAADIVIT